MRLSTGAARSAAKVLPALLALSLLASPARAGSGWPGAESAQPLVQAPRVCSPNIVPINHRCRVLAFEPLGEFDGRAWYYAFYGTHWADRHGRQDRGFPVFLYLEAPATLRLGLWVNDAPGLAGRWATTPPSSPTVIRQGDDVYMGLTLHNVGRTPDQRLFQLHGERWRPIRILQRSEEDLDRIERAMPRGCSRGGEAFFDWDAFEVAWPLETELTGAPCGSMVAGFTVRGKVLALTDVRVEREAFESDRP
jgi:hypothetical protein